LPAKHAQTAASASLRSLSLVQQLLVLAAAFHEGAVGRVGFLGDVRAGRVAGGNRRDAGRELFADDEDTSALFERPAAETAGPEIGKPAQILVVARQRAPTWLTAFNLPASSRFVRAIA
jgi:hypothetical protein